MRAKINNIITMFVCLILLCCTEKTKDIKRGVWRAVLTVPGGELPFLLELSGREPLTAYILNGEDRVAVKEVQTEGNKLVLVLPAFNSKIEAQLQQSRLTGALTLVKRGGKTQVIPFAAAPGQAYRFFPEEESGEVDVSGKWDVTFREDDGTTSKAIGLFNQNGNRLTGTFMTTTGDYRFLDGQVNNGKIYLSCFDGGHAFLFTANVNEDQSLSGDFWSGTAWHESWTARKDDKASLPDAFEMTYMKEGYDKFDFSFPDLNGNLVSLSDSRFKGKVLLITLAGSWCPNCHDEAKFLSRFYKANQFRGLEIIGLMYEHYRDFDKAVRQIKRFKEKFDIDYELLVAGYSDKKEASQTLPMLNQVISFPTSIFIDRKGKVRRIHTGFAGPATGDYYPALANQFKFYIDYMLWE